MPWLTGTAFLHALMIQEEARNAKVVERLRSCWPPGRSRSWAVPSFAAGHTTDHAFGGADLGVPFVVLIAV